MMKKTAISQKKYPYQNTSLQKIKRERWKDIPGLDGYYRISNLGRVKRNHFEIIYSSGQVHQLNERIMVPEIATQENKSVGDTNYFLRIKITLQGVCYNYSISRLLYSLFIKPFDLKDYSRVVIPKDGNGRNVALKNLVLVCVQRKQQRIFERDRLHRNTYHTYDEFLETGSETSINPACKQVSQYTLTGQWIRTLPSIKAAALVLGVSESGIISVLKKRQITSYGYVWAYGKQKMIDVAAIRTANLVHFKQLRGQKVTQYNLEGKRIARYLAIAEASRFTGVNPSDIHAVLTGKQRTAGGCIWKRGWNRPVKLQGNIL